jgi:hypothetical protein
VPERRGGEHILLFLFNLRPFFTSLQHNVLARRKNEPLLRFCFPLPSNQTTMSGNKDVMPSGKAFFRRVINGLAAAPARGSLTLL